MSENEPFHGFVELRPLRAVPVNEAWFWDTPWQSGEVDVDLMVAQGRVVVSDGPDAFINSLLN